jgi:tryptophan-rich sensory protein
MFATFLFLLVVIIFVAILGTSLTYPGLEWFESLQKPYHTPPGWILSVTWAILYLLWLLANFFAIESLFPGARQSWLLILAILSAVLLLLWCFVFFTRRSVVGGVVVMLILLVVSFIQIREFLMIGNTLAVSLYLPFVIWIAFVLLFNVALAVGNR